MKRLLILVFFLCGAAAAQDKPSALDQAYEQARAAYNALKAAEARRDEGVASEPGERLGTAAGGSRPSENYFARQARLEHEVELAQRRYDAAMKRWNDLK